MTDSLVDSQGNIFLLDAGKSKIQKISPDNKILLEFGSSGNGPGQFSNPSGLALDTNGYST